MGDRSANGPARLSLTSHQAEALSGTVRQHAEAFNRVSEAGWEAKRIHGDELHQETYHPLRAALDLPRQLVITARRMAVEAPKSTRVRQKQGQAVSRLRTDNPSIRFDARSYRRDWATLQARLTVIGGRLARFRLDRDHKISYRLVRSCEPGDTIVFEHLTHLRNRAKARGLGARRRLPARTFARLGALVGYKAALRGIRVANVDPRDTSRRCPGWDHREAANRKSQKRFRCVRCGFERNAGLVGSWNIRDRYEGLWAPGPRGPGPVTGPNPAVAR